MSGVVNFYAGSRLDRRANSRIDDDLVLSWLDSPSARFLPLWRSQHLLNEAGDAGRLEVVRAARAELGLAGAALDALPWTFLGHDEAGPLFSVDFADRDSPPALAVPGRFEELRPVAPLLTLEEAALLAQARGMHAWRRTHRFCGTCGLPMRPEHGGHRLTCGNGHMSFPRTDPVVIMLVQHGDRALLARGVRFPPDSRTLSALAGFIEPGESAEEAVAREVWEEAGVRVRDVRYHSSQPWPFPGSLMLGFTAEADDPTLTIDPEELVEARWLTRDQVRNHEAEGFELPGPAAIARQLILSWLDG